MASHYRMCKRCIMDTTDPDIQFDENGICNHCRNYYVRVANEVHSGAVGNRHLDEIVARIKSHGHGKEYDCVTGVSGGADSTMVMYTLNRLGLRPLVVHFDNGWNTELANENVKKMLDILNIELHTTVVDWEEFKDLQLSFLKASVPNAEIPTDHAINALLFNAAARYNIKYIIGGGNVATEGILPRSWGYYNQDLRHLKAIHKRFGKVPLKTLPELKLTEFLYNVFVRGIRIIPILNYSAYKKPEGMKIIQKEFGWRDYGLKHYESIYTRFFQGYILPKKFGYDKRRAHLSCLLCSGDMIREDALAEMKRDPYANYNLDEDKALVIKRLGITEQEFDRIMNLPVKSHSDYPSNTFVFDGLSGLRAMFKKITTSA